MAEYIDRESLYKKMEGRYKYSSGKARDAYRISIDDILDEPSADVAPVRHGEWLWLDGCGERVACSECLEIFFATDDVNAGNEWDFCPKCGTKMDRGDD